MRTQFERCETFCCSSSSTASIATNKQARSQQKPRHHLRGFTTAAAARFSARSRQKHKRVHAHVRTHSATISLIDGKHERSTVPFHSNAISLGGKEVKIESVPTRYFHFRERVGAVRHFLCPRGGIICISHAQTCRTDGAPKAVGSNNNNVSQRIGERRRASPVSMIIIIIS